jgi:hypothetical protein
MKRLFFLLVFLSVFLTCCEKEKRYCYDCDLFIYNSTTKTFDKNYREYCDKTQEEITTIMRQHSVPHLEYMECTKRTK